jgi:hypothetical protein
VRPIASSKTPPLLCAVGLVVVVKSILRPTGIVRRISGIIGFAWCAVGDVAVDKERALGPGWRETTVQYSCIIEEIVAIKTGIAEEVFVYGIRVTSSRLLSR